MTGFYNRDGMCLLRGTDWDFKSDGYSFVIKRLMNRACLLRGTDWVFKSDGYSFVIKRLRNRESVYCAVRTGTLNQTDTVS